MVPSLQSLIAALSIGRLGGAAIRRLARDWLELGRRPVSEPICEPRLESSHAGWYSEPWMLAGPRDDEVASGSVARGGSTRATVYCTRFFSTLYRRAASRSSLRALQSPSAIALNC